MPIFKAIRLQLFRHRASPCSREAVIKEVRGALARKNWMLLPVTGTLAYKADLLARKANIDIAVKCSGLNSRLFASQIRDLREHCVKQSLHPVFVAAEKVEPQVLSCLYQSSEVLLNTRDLDDIEDRVAELRPLVVGAIDWIGLPNVIQGWAKLSPVSGSATIVAQMKDEVLGRCEASGIPSASGGHATHGFRLILSRKLERREILNELRVKVLYRGEYIRLLQIWDHAPVIETGAA